MNKKTKIPSSNLEPQHFIPVGCLPWECEVTITWQCFACNKQASVSSRYPRGSQVAHPSLPRGWKQIDYMLFCKDHEITAIVDNEIFTGITNRVKDSLTK